MRRGWTWLVCAITAMMCLGLAACGSPATSESPKDKAATAESASSSSGASTSAGSPTVESSSSQSEKSEKSVGVYINLDDNSILLFDEDAASAQLVDDMVAGRTPTSCTVLYDQMGSLPSVTVTDARTIREVYSRLARMRVEGASNMSITDSYHRVSFELQDGTTVSYNFEGADILVRGRQNYAVLDRGDLWSYVRHLQDQYLREQAADDDWPAITLEDDEELVLQCPTSAPAGEVVQVQVYAMLDAYVHIAVNGDEDYGAFVSAQEYEFVMPESPVTIHVWSALDGLAGS